MSEHEINFIYLPVETAQKNEQKIDLGSLKVSEYATAFKRYPHFSTVVFVPIQTLLIMSLHLPLLKNLAKGRVEPLLYAAENALSEDVEKFEAVILAHQKLSGHYTAAIFPKTLMESWFFQLESFNALPAIVLPDIYLLPYKDSNTWTVFFNANTVMVRTGIKTGFCIEKENCVLYFESLLSRATLSDMPELVYPEMPERLAFYYAKSQESTAVLLSESIKNMNNIVIEIEHEVLEKDMTLWELYKKTPQQFPEVNLLEHYSQNVSFARSRQLKKWKWPAILLGSWMGILLLSGFSEYFYLKAENKKLDKAVSEIYFDIYPQATDVTSPKERMQQDLKLAGINKEKFWAGLIKLDAALEREPKAEPKSLRYENGQFQLMITANSNAEIFDRLNAAFKSNDLQVSNINIISSGQEVSETITVGVK